MLRIDKILVVSRGKASSVEVAALRYIAASIATATLDSQSVCQPVDNATYFILFTVTANKGGLQSNAVRAVLRGAATKRN